MSRIFNSRGELIRQSKNLRGVIDHARRSPVARVLLENREGMKGQPVNQSYRVQFSFDNGDVAFADFADWRVAAGWIKARRSWDCAINATHGFQPFVNLCRDLGLAVA